MKTKVSPSQIGNYVFFLFCASWLLRHLGVFFERRAELKIVRGELLFHDPGLLIAENLEQVATTTQEGECPGKESQLRAETIYGTHFLARSVMSEGTGFRVSNFLRKAREGRPLKIASIGSHIASGDGLAIDPATGRLPNYANHFMDWLNGTYPHYGHELYTAPPADIPHLSFCAYRELPSDVELVFLESSDTALGGLDHHQLNFENLERVLRAISRLPRSPAIILLSAFSPQEQLDRARLYNMLDLNTHVRELASYYDIPHISVAAAMAPIYNAHHEKILAQYFQSDLRLPNAAGHALISDVLVHYLSKRSCTPTLYEEGMEQIMKANGILSQAGAFISRRSSSGLLSYEPLPMPLATGDSGHGREAEPFCRSISTKENETSYTEIHGWTAWHRTRRDLPPGYESDVEGSYIRTFAIPVTEGIVGVQYIGGPDMGVVDCWMDDKRRKAKRIDAFAKVEPRSSLVAILHRDAEPGLHSVTCSIPISMKRGRKRKTFRILGVMST